LAYWRWDIDRGPHAYVHEDTGRKINYLHCMRTHTYYACTQHIYALTSTLPPYIEACTCTCTHT